MPAGVATSFDNNNNSNNSNSNSAYQKKLVERKPSYRMWSTAKCHSNKSVESQAEPSAENNWWKNATTIAPNSCTGQFSVGFSVPSQFSVGFVTLDILYAHAVAVYTR